MPSSWWRFRFVSLFLGPTINSGPSLEEVELDFDTEALDQMLEQ